MLQINAVQALRWRHLHCEREDAAFCLSTAQPNLAPMTLAEMLADYQTEPNALVIHFLHVFELSKLLEQELLVFLADTNPCVLNLD